MFADQGSISPVHTDRPTFYYLTNKHPHFVVMCLLTRANKEGWSPAEEWSVNADPGEDLLWLLGRR